MQASIKQLKRSLALLLLALLPAAGRAQFVVVKAGGGLASSYSDARVVGSYKIGLGYEYELGGNWSLEAGLYYNGKGYKEKDRTVLIVDDEGNPVLDDQGQQRTGKVNHTVNAQYVSLPVVVHYYAELMPQKYLVLSAGPYLAYGVGGKDKTRGDVQLEGYRRYYSDQSTFKVDGTHRTDLGLQFGLGYQWTQTLTVGLEAELGLLRFRPGNRRNLSALLTLSYRFRTDN